MNIKARVIFTTAVSSTFILLMAACGIFSGTGKVVRFKIEGISMKPNFQDGTIVKMEPVEASELKRGDVVYFGIENKWFSIKRIIGLPEETVSIHDHGIYINGEVLNDDFGGTPPDYEMAAVTLGSSEYFVLGDNRNNSADSHAFGPIPAENIKYRLISP